MCQSRPSRCTLSSAESSCRDKAAKPCERSNVNSAGQLRKVETDQHLLVRAVESGTVVLPRTVRLMMALLALRDLFRDPQRGNQKPGKRAGRSKVILGVETGAFYAFAVQCVWVQCVCLVADNPALDCRFFPKFRPRKRLLWAQRRGARGARRWASGNASRSERPSSIAGMAQRNP